MNEQQLAQYNQLYNQLLNSSSQTPTAIPMTSGGAVQGGTNFLNSPEYALLYGQQNAAQQAANMQNGTYNPITAFQQDPGFQFNLSQALAQTQNASAAKGLLNSGSTQNALLNQASGLQNQQYQTWLGQQNNLFNNYQNQLANLSNLGANASNQQASQVNNNSNLLAQLLSNANLSTGQGISNANLGTGQTIAQLLANQGVLNAGAYLNTGAAQANNLFQGANLQTQINANNSASAAGTQGSYNNLNSLGGSYSGGSGQTFQLPNGYVGNGPNPFGSMY